MRAKILMFASFALAGIGSAQAGDVTSLRVKDYAVTVYRAPGRSEGGFNLDDLNGFALVSEVRHVSLPAGLSRLRFEGVAGGIQPASALVTGLPEGVVEKNRDAALLSPSALIEATVGKAVILKRTNRKTGTVEDKRGTLISGADGGVVFKSDTGIEALRCSGMAETFVFEPPEGLSARPTLSVLVKTETPIEQDVTLSYLTVGFDWAATYTATLSADERNLSLGAWVTLANSNDAMFNAARTQVVAGRVNRENDSVEPIGLGESILAQCWPHGTTSDIPEERVTLQATRGFTAGIEVARMMAPAPMAADALYEVVVTSAKKVQEEQLGDLKLYRVPDRTTVASRQSKQVRLLDRERIPVRIVYGFDLRESQFDADESVPATRVLRTKNDAADHLGLPLPSGSVEVYQDHGEGALLADETELKDVAVDEDVELKLSNSDQVRVRLTAEREGIDSRHARELPLLPGVSMRSVEKTGVFRAVVSNALPHAVDFEFKLALPDGARIVRADHEVTRKDGQPLIKLAVPANGEATVLFAAAAVEDRAVPSR
ncbi:MAG TPA: hypothetical protein VGI93_19295 [Steroidobacteraceae bacterium]